MKTDARKSLAGLKLKSGGLTTKEATVLINEKRFLKISFASIGFSLAFRISK